MLRCREPPPHVAHHHGAPRSREGVVVVPGRNGAASVAPGEPSCSSSPEQAGGRPTAVCCLQRGPRAACSSWPCCTGRAMPATCAAPVCSLAHVNAALHPRYHRAAIRRPPPGPRAAPHRRRPPTPATHRAAFAAHHGEQPDQEQRRPVAAGPRLTPHILTARSPTWGNGLCAT